MDKIEPTKIAGSGKGVPSGDPGLIVSILLAILIPLGFICCLAMIVMNLTDFGGLH